VVIGSRSVPVLAGGGSWGATSTLTLPANLNGTYYVFACSDGSNQVAETDESNCVRSDAFTVNGADLTEGCGAQPLTLPVSLNGSYYIQACADAYNVVAEPDESDNCAKAPIAVKGADLVESVDLTNTTASAGGTIQVSETVTNQAPAGGGKAGASTTFFYLSQGGVAKAYIGSQGVGVLAAGASVTTNPKQLTLPINITAGTYHVMACADVYGLVLEPIETNNCSLESQGIVTVQ